jgi:hypothetical protein
MGNELQNSTNGVPNASPVVPPVKAEEPGTKYFYQIVYKFRTETCF